MSNLDDAAKEFEAVFGNLDRIPAGIALAVIAGARAALDEMEARIKARSQGPDVTICTKAVPPAPIREDGN